MIAPVTELSGSSKPREKGAVVVETKQMHLKALTVECGAVFHTLGRVKGHFKELTESKQRSQVERDRQIPQRKMSNIIPQQTKERNHYWQILEKHITDNLGEVELCPNIVKCLLFGHCLMPRAAGPTCAPCTPGKQKQPRHYEKLLRVSTLYKRYI